MPGVMDLPLMSRSGLEASQCGLRYKRLYVEGMQDDGPFSRRGSAYHMVKKLYIQRLAAAGTPMDEEEAKQAFAEGIALSKCPPQYVEEVREIFDRHVLHFELDLDAYHSNEVRVVRPDAPVPYQYEPDLTYIHSARNEVEIIDDKTYYVGVTEAQAKKLLQTRYYVWAAMQEFPGFDTYRFTYNFVRLNTFVSVTFDKDDFAMLDQEIVAIETSRRMRHDQDDWEAVPGDVCAFCSLACPVLDDPDRAHVRVNSPESFAKAAGRKLVNEKESKAITAALKAYANLHGAQTVNGEVFAFRPSVSRSYPIAAVVDLVRSKGLEPLAYVSASALKALFKTITGLREALLSTEQAKESARFTHKSLKSETREAPDAAMIGGQDDDE